MPISVDSDKLKDLVNVGSEDGVDNSQFTTAETLAADYVSDNFSGSDESGSRAATYLAAHIITLMARGASPVTSDGDIKIEGLEAKQTIYSDMFEKEMDNNDDLLFDMAG